MYNRNNANRQLYTRNGDGNSERWSQQFMCDSQDWGTQFSASQETSRGPAARPQSHVLNSSQGSSRGCGIAPGTSVHNVAQPLAPSKDMHLARDIRFCLHTILSVMRELPNQLRELSGEVQKSSQQPEKTNDLVKETSEKLQSLVLGLETKLSQLLDNKENSDLLQQSLSEHDAHLSSLISKLEEFVGQHKQDEQEKFEDLKNISKKELRREFKKFSESLTELKSSSMVEEKIESIQAEVGKLFGKLAANEDDMKSVTIGMQSAVSEQHCALENHFKQCLGEMQSVMDSVVEKVSGLPQKIHSEVCQAVHDAFHNMNATSKSLNNNAGHLFSPVGSGVMHHRPVQWNCYRSQVSPVAQVPPLMSGASTKEAQKALKEQEVLDLSNRLSSGNIHKPFVSTLPKRKKDAENMQENLDNKLHIRLLESETQHFTPEHLVIKNMSDSEESILLHCDTGSSSSDECSMEIAITDDFSQPELKGICKKFGVRTSNLETHQTKRGVSSDTMNTFPTPRPRSVATPNVRKTPSMDPTQPPRSVVMQNVCKASSMVIANQESPIGKDNGNLKEMFVKPIAPVPGKKARTDLQIQKLQPAAVVTEGGFPAFRSPLTATLPGVRSRRMLTPLSSQGIKLKFSNRKKKI